MTMSVDEDFDAGPPAHTSATSRAKKGSPFLGRATVGCTRVVVPASESRYWWDRFVKLDGGWIQFPEPQLEQANDPELNDSTRGHSQLAQMTIRPSK
jgi:hypothetical protein